MISVYNSNYHMYVSVCFVCVGRKVLTVCVRGMKCVCMSRWDECYKKIAHSVSNILNLRWAQRSVYFFFYFISNTGNFFLLGIGKQFDLSYRCFFRFQNNKNVTYLDTGVWRHAWMWAGLDVHRRLQRDVPHNFHVASLHHTYFK